MHRFGKWKPALPKGWLFGLAGLIWLGVGSAMVVAALGWLKPLSVQEAVPFALGGAAVAVVIWRRGFSRVAARNIARLEEKPTLVCIFAFQSWRSYLLVALMVALGAALRHSSLPKPLLASLYLGIGGALALASSAYFRRLAA